MLIWLNNLGMGGTAGGLTWTSRGPVFLYTEANYSAINFFFQTFLKAVSGTAYARFYNKTDSKAVASSELSTASGTHTRLRSSVIILTDGKEYVTQLGAGASSHGDIEDSRLVVK